MLGILRGPRNCRFYKEWLVSVEGVFLACFWPQPLSSPCPETGGNLCSAMSCAYFRFPKARECAVTQTFPCSAGP